LGIFTEAAALAAAFSFSDLAPEMSLESEKPRHYGTNMTKRSKRQSVVGWLSDMVPVAGNWIDLVIKVVKLVSLILPRH